MQINPPFDGSIPCPACQRGLPTGYLHNFLTRCEPTRIRDNKAFVRLVDMRSHGLPRELTVPHPASIEVLEVCRALMTAIAGIEVDGMGTIRWTPEIRERVEALIPRAMAAADAFEALQTVCRADRRHSSGEPNVIRESFGSRWAGFLKPDYTAAAYAYTVAVVEDGADITHTACGVGLKLHDHFLSNIRRDPTFYGKAWCPRCKLEAPFAQFVCETVAA